MSERSLKSIRSLTGSQWRSLRGWVLYDDFGFSHNIFKERQKEQVLQDKEKRTEQVLEDKERQTEQVLQDKERQTEQVLEDKERLKEQVLQDKERQTEQVLQDRDNQHSVVTWHHQAEREEHSTGSIGI